MQLKRYNHPNIMKIETWFKNKNRDRVNMIINYVGTETLRKYVGRVSKKGSIQEETVKKIFG
jgi:arginine deiminase